jgi:hypothetical protein
MPHRATLRIAFSNVGLLRAELETTGIGLAARRALISLPEWVGWACIRLAVPPADPFPVAEDRIAEGVSDGRTK